MSINTVFNWTEIVTTQFVVVTLDSYLSLSMRKILKPAGHS